MFCAILGSASPAERIRTPMEDVYASEGESDEGRYTELKPVQDAPEARQIATSHYEPKAHAAPELLHNAPSEPHHNVPSVPQLTQPAPTRENNNNNIQVSYVV